MTGIKHEIKKIALSSEAVDIVQNLIRIPSHWAQEKRELPIAEYLQGVFLRENIQSDLIEVIQGRPNAMAVLKGSGGGKSLMLNGHIDTVPPFGMEDPFSAKISDGKIFGRGAADMKSGVGMMAYALILLKRLNVNLKGDLVFAGVIDEDAAGSAGTRHIVKNGPITDFAIVGEPTSLHPVVAHKGCDYFEVEFLGRSVHSSVPEKGVNSNYAAAEYISLIENELIPKYKNIKHEFCSPPTINVGLVQGAAQANMPFLHGVSPTYAGIVSDRCRVYIDVRWVPNQTIQEVEDDLRGIAEIVKNNRGHINYDLEYIPMSRPAMEIDPDSQLVKSVIQNSKFAFGKSIDTTGETYWGDSGLLWGLAQIPSMMYGPGDISCAHSDLEWVDIDQLAKSAMVYAMTALDICGYE